MKQIAIIAVILLCSACQSQPDTTRLCTPLILNEIAEQNYRDNLRAESEAQARVIWAERSAVGIMAIEYALAFSVALAACWIARQLWYFERFVKG